MSVARVAWAALALMFVLSFTMTFAPWQAAVVVTVVGAFFLGYWTRGSGDDL